MHDVGKPTKRFSELSNTGMCRRKTRGFSQNMASKGGMPRIA
ncbi:hypothetical protein HMPREF0762_01457 [Slackia exigua ATCC 700122]|uniref:Uncharacterized protein n=1 Tax=Slackia exigua (strain ATCC 700122 / DSM 15923 / CIP 105133 / JCM 11022 / KCTC 5966 / S-7) TaxID=649764 RepID=D0WHY5_SLAES|nr:hypothetical protein HMPREF0762_01457 [Slackia exigua ATCC 700122]